MKSYKEFIKESLSSDDVDDIKEFYIEFRDEWGFIETKNVHSYGENECSFRLRDRGTLLTVYIRMAFQIGSQDIDECYNSLKEMCDRIKSLNPEIRVYHSKSVSDTGDLFLSLDIFPPK